MTSAKFELVKKYYKTNMWSIEQVKNAVVKEWITPEEFYEITGELYI